MEARTAKSELTRAVIVDAALALASAEGLEAITLQAVADRVGLSKSGVFSRVGSREALQQAVVEEYDRRFLADVFVPAMREPKGLPRLDAIVSRWIERGRDVESRTGCLYVAGAFEFDDRDGPLRDLVLKGVIGWRSALRRTVLQAIEQKQLAADTRPDDLAADIYSVMIGLLHDARFLRDPQAADQAHARYARLVRGYLPV